jgi:hypothetical protein
MGVLGDSPDPHNHRHISNSHLVMEHHDSGLIRELKWFET